jgi:hypothetical protein
VRERERGFCNRSKSYPQVTMISNIEQVDGKKKKNYKRIHIIRKEYEGGKTATTKNEKRISQSHQAYNRDKGKGIEL